MKNLYLYFGMALFTTLLSVAALLLVGTSASLAGGGGSSSGDGGSGQTYSVTMPDGTRHTGLSHTQAVSTVAEAGYSSYTAVGDSGGRTSGVSTGSSESDVFGGNSGGWGGRLAGTFTPANYLTPINVRYFAPVGYTRIDVVSRNGQTFDVYQAPSAAGSAPPRRGTVPNDSNSFIGVPRLAESDGTPTPNPSNPNPFFTPTVTLSATPTTALPGQPITLAWSSTNTTACSAPWTSNTATSGNETVTVSEGETTYRITCTGLGGEASDTVTITPTTPVVTLTVDRNLIRQGDRATINWTITPVPEADATLTCDITGVTTPVFQTTESTGTTTTTPINNFRRLTIDCSIYSISYTDEVTVSVIPSFQEL